MNAQWQHYGSDPCNPLVVTGEPADNGRDGEGLVLVSDGADHYPVSPEVWLARLDHETYQAWCDLAAALPWRNGLGRIYDAGSTTLSAEETAQVTAGDYRLVDGLVVIGARTAVAPARRGE